VVLKHWIGHVDELDDDTVWATLYDGEEDATSRIPREVVEMYRHAFGEIGSSNLYVGATFDWWIESEPTVSRISVRPAVLWTQEMLDGVRERARIMFEELNSLFDHGDVVDSTHGTDNNSGAT
jgi:hypothetical protein